MFYIYVHAQRITEGQNKVILLEENGILIDEGDTIKIHGPSVVRYDPKHPNAMLAKCWVQTESQVTVDGRPHTGI